MGEARRRREAKAAGRYWPEDLPKVSPYSRQYLGDDGEWHSREGLRGQHQRPRPNTALLLSLAATLGGTGLPKPTGGRR